MSDKNTGTGSFKKVLFCTDFSENADFAFNYAVDISAANGASELYLLHVIPESESQFWKTYIYEVEDVDNKARHDIDEHIDQAYRSKLPDGMQLHVEFRIGKDSEQILDFVREKQIDLIVIGRESTGSLQKPFFGNITEKLTRKADCAVLVVPKSYQQKLMSKRIQC